MLQNMCFPNSLLQWWNNIVINIFYRANKWCLLPVHDTQNWFVITYSFCYCCNRKHVHAGVELYKLNITIEGIQIMCVGEGASVPSHKQINDWVGRGPKLHFCQKARSKNYLNGVKALEIKIWVFFASPSEWIVKYKTE